MFIQTRPRTFLFLFLFIVVVGSIVFSILRNDTSDQKEAIHIALAGPMSGELREGVGMKESIMLYVDKVNRGGGINGKQIVLDTYDDKDDPVEAEKVALKIAEDGKAVAVIGHYYSTCSRRAGRIYKKYGIPAVTPESDADDITQGNPWYFRTIYNNSLQAKFLATYMKYALGADEVAIVSDPTLFGRSLAQTFTRTAREIGLTITNLWEVDPGGKTIESQIERFLSPVLSEKKKVNVFLAAHEAISAKFVWYLKRHHLGNIIMGSDSTASKAFVEALKLKQPKERKADYFSEGVYLVCPMIYDIADEGILQFRQSFESKYGTSPDPFLPLSYSTSELLIEAIRKGNVRGKEETLAEDRKKIRDVLAGMNSQETAVTSLTGPIFFDDNGNSVMPPVYVGIYDHNNVISPMAELEYIFSKRKLYDLQPLLADKKIIELPNLFLVIKSIAYAGIYINSIEDINFSKKVADLDFNLWLRYQSGLDVTNLCFPNAVEPVSMNHPVESVDVSGTHQSYRLYRIRGKFRMDFIEPQSLPDQHTVGIQFRNCKLPSEFLDYVVDYTDLNLKNHKNIIDGRRQDSLLHNQYKYAIRDTFMFSAPYRKRTLGNPELSGVLDESTVDYSGIDAGILIGKERFFVRTLLPAAWSPYIIYPCLFGLLGLFFMRRTGVGKDRNRLMFLVQILLIFLILAASEKYLLRCFDKNTPLRFLERLETLYDTLWLLIPGVLLIFAVKHFAWDPLEKRTGTPIPNLMRNAVGLVILFVTSAIILASVFHLNVVGIFATSGILTIFLGVALHSNLSSIISGLALNLERPFRIGDWVKIGGHEGEVVDINWRTTRLRSSSDVIISISNSDVTTTEVENFSMMEGRTSDAFSIYLSPKYSPETVFQILADSVRSLGLVPGIWFLEANSWAIEYQVQYALEKYDDKRSKTKTELWQLVWTNLKNAGMPPALRGSPPRSTYLLESVEAESISKLINLFEPLPTELRNQISSKMKLRSFPKGGMIVKKGAPGKSMYVVMEGIVGVGSEKEETSTDMQILPMGTVVGIRCLLTGGQRESTLIAKTNCSLYKLTKEDLLPILEKKPEVVCLFGEKLSRYTLKKEIRDRPLSVEELHANQEGVAQQIRDFYGLEGGPSVIPEKEDIQG